MSEIIAKATNGEKLLAAAKEKNIATYSRNVLGQFKDGQELNFITKKKNSCVITEYLKKDKVTKGYTFGILTNLSPKPLEVHSDDIQYIADDTAYKAIVRAEVINYEKDGKQLTFNKKSLYFTNLAVVKPAPAKVEDNDDDDDDND